MPSTEVCGTIKMTMIVYFLNNIQKIFRSTLTFMGGPINVALKKNHYMLGGGQINYLHISAMFCDPNTVFPT